MRYAIIALGLVAMASEAGAQTPERSPANAHLTSAFALIAPDLVGLAVRTDISEVGDQIIFRTTPTNLQAETQRRRPAPSHVLEVRITRTALGEVTRMTMTGEVTTRPRIRVGETSTEVARTSALSTARYGEASAADVRAMALQRGAALGADATVSAAALVWWRAGAELEPVWQVRVQVAQPLGRASYLATYAAADGMLLELTREDGR